MYEIVYLFDRYPVSAWVETAVAWTVIALTMLIIFIIETAIAKKRGKNGRYKR